MNDPEEGLFSPAPGVAPGPGFCATGSPLPPGVGPLVLEGLLLEPPPPKSMKPPTISSTSASPPRPAPRMTVMETPLFFFRGRSSSSSSSSRRRGPVLAFGLPGATLSDAPGFPFLPGARASEDGFIPSAFLAFLLGAGVSLEDSSSSSPLGLPFGFSTTKRYLHLGQSILRPIRPGSRMGTIASQLGHCCLKLVVDAMKGSPPRQGPARTSREEKQGRGNFCYHKRNCGKEAKMKNLRRHVFFARTGRTDGIGRAAAIIRWVWRRPPRSRSGLVGKVWKRLS